MTTLQCGPHPFCFGGLLLSQDATFRDYLIGVIEREFACTPAVTGNWFLPDTGMALKAAVREHRLAALREHRAEPDVVATLSGLIAHLDGGDGWTS